MHVVMIQIMSGIYNIICMSISLYRPTEQCPCPFVPVLFSSLRFLLHPCTATHKCILHMFCLQSGFFLSSCYTRFLQINSRNCCMDKNCANRNEMPSAYDCFSFRLRPSSFTYQKQKAADLCSNSVCGRSDKKSKKKKSYTLSCNVTKFQNIFYFSYFLVSILSSFISSNQLCSAFHCVFFELLKCSIKVSTLLNFSFRQTSKHVSLFASQPNPYYRILC